MEDVGTKLEDELEDVGTKLEEETDQTQKKRAYAPGKGTSRRWRFSEGGEMTTEIIRKFIELQKLPIEKNIRFADLVARYKDFPWAQDTIMATYQLEEVLVKFLWRHLELPTETLRQWREAGELHQRAIIELARYDVYHEAGERPDIEHMIANYMAQA